MREQGRKRILERGPAYSGNPVTRSGRKPTPSGLSLTHKFIEAQTGVSDAFGPDLNSVDRDEERFGR